MAGREADLLKALVAKTADAIRKPLPQTVVDAEAEADAERYRQNVSNAAPPSNGAVRR